MEMLTKIITGLDDVVAISKNIAVNEIYGASKNRIFNLGEDKYNRKLGGYTSSYKAKRKNKGLQTSFKDLTFTTNLQKSISRNDDTIYFGNEYGKKISYKLLLVSLQSLLLQSQIVLVRIKKTIETLSRSL